MRIRMSFLPFLTEFEGFKCPTEISPWSCLLRDSENEEYAAERRILRIPDQQKHTNNSYSGSSVLGFIDVVSMS